MERSDFWILRGFLSTEDYDKCTDTSDGDATTRTSYQDLTSQISTPLSLREPISAVYGRRGLCLAMLLPTH